MDTSASMKARDVSPTRFDAARDAAIDFVRSLRQGTQVMVMEAGVQPRVLAEMGTDRQHAINALRKSAPRDLPNRLPDALRTAQGLLGTDERAEIHVFT